MSDEQHDATPTTTAEAAIATTEATPRWGDPLDRIPQERQEELRALADQQAEWAKQEQPNLRQSPLAKATRGDKKQVLTGAEVFFLAAYAIAGPDGDLEAAAIRLRAIKQNDSETWVNLLNLHLEGADLSAAHLEGADLHSVHLEGANLIGTHLEGANLPWTHLGGANLYQTNLEGADLEQAHLERTYINQAHLAGAHFVGACLEGASLINAHLEGADLRGASLDSKTCLNEATIDQLTQLGDLQWSGVGAVNLTQIAWRAVAQLGDEHRLQRNAKAEEVERAVRAYRQLAAQLRAQGMSEVADRFAYRAQICQRRVLWKQRRIPQWLGSVVLAILAGYGFKPGRSLLVYLGIILAYMALYLHFGTVDGHPFNGVEATVFSLTSFHGRGFFPGGLKLDDPVTVIAASEALFGLLIEISFIATFTQRFFGAK